MQDVKIFEAITMDLATTVAKDWQNKGDTYFSQKNYDAARTSYEKTIELGSKAPWPQFRLGIIAQKKNEPEKAIAYFKQAMALNPKNVIFYTVCAASHLKQNQHQKAVVCYEQAIALNPDLPRPYEQLGEIQQALAQLTAAKSSYEKAIELGSRAPWVRFKLGRIAQQQNKQGNSDAAYYWYQAAIDLNPNNAQFYYYLDILQSQQSNTTAARASYTKALDVNPTFKPALDAIDALSYINAPIGNVFENSFFAIPANKAVEIASPDTDRKASNTIEESTSPTLFQRILRKFRQ